MSNKHYMEDMTPEWIRKRLGDDRGQQAKLAEAIGISPDKMAKVMSGVRKIKAHEIPLIYKFFKLEAEVVTREEKALLDLFRGASSERLAVVEAALRYQPPRQDTD